MAKLVFGCALMLGGIIGGTGWLIAVACLTEAGTWSSLFNLFPVLGFGLLDGYVVLLFHAIAVVGAVIASTCSEELTASQFAYNGKDSPK